MLKKLINTDFRTSNFNLSCSSWQTKLSEIKIFHFFFGIIRNISTLISNAHTKHCRNSCQGKVHGSIARCSIPRELQAVRPRSCRPTSRSRQYRRGCSVRWKDKHACLSLIQGKTKIDCSLSRAHSPECVGNRNARTKLHGSYHLILFNTCSDGFSSCVQTHGQK